VNHEGVTAGNWQTADHVRWSFQHIADLFPTALISRGAGPVAPLPELHRQLDDLRVLSPYFGWTTLGAVIGTTFTDGWIAVRAGQVIAEQYPAGMRPPTRHLLMSVSKSFVGCVVAALSAQRVLDVEDHVTHYVPALRGTGYAGATLRHLLDMRSGIRFSEEYLDPDAEVRLMEEAIGWAPRRDPAVPTSMCAFLASLVSDRPHGGPFAYRSCESDVLGWVCEAATGIRMPKLMSDLFWSRLGAEHDADIGVDSEGTGMFDGGISATLRDLARFGAMILRDGTSLTGEQVVPESWIRDSYTGGPDSRRAFAASPDDNRMPGGMYRNQFWVPYPDRDVLLCLGIHGQMVYVNPRADLVAAKLSSWPVPQDASRLFGTLAAFDAIAETGS
jgi:CubicO group peptidase (beta-lactamase class C family)